VRVRPAKLVTSAKGSLKGSPSPPPRLADIN